MLDYHKVEETGIFTFSLRFDFAAGWQIPTGCCATKQFGVMNGSERWTKPTQSRQRRVSCSEVTSILLCGLREGKLRVELRSVGSLEEIVLQLINRMGLRMGLRSMLMVELRL